MSQNTENVKLGVCNVLFDGVDLGFTKGGVEVEVATTTHEVKVDQYGETVISEIITGRSVSVAVPLAETTLDNLVAIMPGSDLVSDGVKATGTVTFSASAPVNNDSITVGGTTFTFKTVPAASNEMPIPATIGAAATALADKINAAAIPFAASANAAIVTITAKTRGTAGNVTVAKTAATPANITTTNLTGGVNPTKEGVAINTGINVNLLSIAKTLVLRPIGTTGKEDFTVLKAACPGALSFAYQTDTERVYSANFKGYVAEGGRLAIVGDRSAFV